MGQFAICLRLLDCVGILVMSMGSVDESLKYIPCLSRAKSFQIPRFARFGNLGAWCKSGIWEAKVSKSWNQSIL